MNSTSKPDYGVDSPAIIAGLATMGALLLGSEILVSLFAHPGLLVRMIWLAAAAYFWLGASGMVWYSRVTKFRLRDRLLAGIAWRGDERVLDIGCGRGLVLIGAANRVPRGEAIGVDVWLKGALSGNSAESVLKNAAAEGVAERVRALEGDARGLPFPDQSFDVVLSNFVLHELKTRAERESMVKEITRVLRPGGRIALIDFIFTDECVRTLREQDLSDARRSRIGRVSFWINAIMNFGLLRLYVVTGSKPGPEGAAGC